MNEALFIQANHDLADNLLAIRKAGDWRHYKYDWPAYIQWRFNLSKTRAKLLCDFAQFVKMCRDNGVPLPETPENVQPILLLPRGQWIDAWSRCCEFAEGHMTAQFCRATLDHFGYGGRKTVPPHVLKARRTRKAMETLAELGDGEKLVDEIGTKALGKNWDKGVRTVIDADQRRMEKDRGS